MDVPIKSILSLSQSLSCQQESEVEDVLHAVYLISDIFTAVMSLLLVCGLKVTND